MATSTSSSGSSLRPDHRILNQHIKVFVRPRPLTKEEEKCPEKRSIIKSLRKREISLALPPLDHEKVFHFDEIFPMEATQAEVYHAVVSPLIAQIIKGYNCTVFAYGQTGSGKTHTMTGHNFSLSPSYNREFMGLIPRALIQLFSDAQTVETVEGKVEYTIRIAFMEIYNEDVRDLLRSEGSTSNQLRIFDDPEHKGSVLVKGLSEVTVCNYTEAFNWLNFGLMQRQTSSTLLNKDSSRSHSIFTIFFHTRVTSITGEEILKTGKIHLVDLAGSENIARSGATGLRIVEAGRINVSLLTLGKVINALAQNYRHIPYRDSKLTRVLQDSLGGKTRTHMIATISPCRDHVDESVNTLDYATMARFVYNSPRINESRKTVSVINQLKDEIATLHRELVAIRTGEGFFVDRDNYNKLVENVQTAAQRQKELQEKILELEEIHKSKEEEFEGIQAAFTTSKVDLLQMEHELEKKCSLVEQQEFMVNYYQAKESQLENTAKNLMNICFETKKSEGIFHEKYVSLCEQNLNTARTARDLYTISTNCFTEIENSTETFATLQFDHYYDIERSANILLKDSIKIESQIEPIKSALFLPLKFEGEHNDLVNAMFEDLSKSISNNKTDYHVIEGEVDKKMCNLKDSISILNNKIKENLSKENTSIKTQAEIFDKLKTMKQHFLLDIKSYHEERKKLQRDFDQLIQVLASVQERMRVLDAMESKKLSQIENIGVLIDQAINLHMSADASPLVADINKSFVEKFLNNGEQIIVSNNLFELARDLSKDHCAEVEKKIINAKNGVTGVLYYAVKKIDNHNENLSEVRKVLDSVCMDISETHEVVTKSILEKIKKCSNVQSDYLELVKNLKSQSASSLNEEFKRINFNVHAGDTPARKKHKFPSQISVDPNRKALLDEYMKLRGCSTDIDTYCDPYNADEEEDLNSV